MLYYFLICVIVISYKMDSRRSIYEERRFRNKSSSKRCSDLQVENLKEIFLNEELKRCSENLGQIIVVDSGCPRSLMGDKELERLRDHVDVFEFNVKDEAFKFGPSRIYKSNKKVTFTMQVGIMKMSCEFFVVHGDIPILLGNDVMVPLGGVIDMEDSKLVLNKVGMEIPLVNTKGGHFVIPVRSVAASESNNIKGEEADAVMMMVLECTDNEDIVKLHDEIGHSIFVALGLTEDEDEQVKKVHRYFGHRSSRRIWDLFAKAKKLRGKKQAVLKVIENCKTCSEFRKSPPRPKVGLSVANYFL